MRILLVEDDADLGLAGSGLGEDAIRKREALFA